MTELLTPLRSLLLPLILIGAAFELLPRLAQLPAHWQQLIPWLPLLLGGLVVLVGWRFNSSRSVQAAALLLGLELLLTNQPRPLMLQGALLLVPLNLALLAWYRERGITSLLGLTRFALLALQIAVLIGLVQQHPATLEPFFNSHWLNNLDFHPLLPQPILLTVTLCTLWLIGRWLSSRDLLDLHLLITLGLVLLTLLTPQGQQHHAIFLGLTLLLWLVALFKRSHAMAYQDELTSLPGRRALNEALLKMGRRYSVAMVDIDHFKKFNDTYGHDLGDQVLKRVAGQLRKTRYGQAYRYGGEEFCILFARRKRQQVIESLEQVRACIEQDKIHIRSPQRSKNQKDGRAQRGKRTGAGRSVSVTVSMGVAERKAGKNPVKLADQALYRAKKQGRNRVCL